MKRLTVIIPTFNEEAYLERALYSINFADEIIVVDSFSTDKTEEVLTRNIAGLTKHYAYTN